jgi:hypothetical protein
MKILQVAAPSVVLPREWFAWFFFISRLSTIVPEGLASTITSALLLVCVSFEIGMPSAITAAAPKNHITTSFDFDIFFDGPLRWILIGVGKMPSIQVDCGCAFVVDLDPVLMFSKIIRIPVQVSGGIFIDVQLGFEAIA